MRWSGLRKLVCDCFTDDLKHRISINSARYGRCSCGHAWITLDGEVIANFCTRAYYNAQANAASERTKKKYDSQYVVYGEGSRQDFYHSCWDFVHKVPIEDALVDPDPVLQAFAVIDRRVGKRRLKKLDPEKLHPLARRLLAERVKAITVV